MVRGPIHGDMMPSERGAFVRGANEGGLKPWTSFIRQPMAVEALWKEPREQSVELGL
jgi:hypothetical protein